MADLEMSPGTQSSYSSEIITVVVGEAGLDQKEFKVHKDIICEVSPFFKNCLASGLTESSEKLVKLPEDEPEIFEVILDWVYGRFDRKVKHKQYDNQVDDLIEAYTMADKFCMEATCNDLMDAVKSYSSKTKLHCDCVRMAVQNATGESRMRRFVVEQIAWDLSNSPSGVF